MAHSPASRIGFRDCSSAATFADQTSGLATTAAGFDLALPFLVLAFPSFLLAAPSSL